MSFARLLLVMVFVAAASSAAADADRNQVSYTRFLDLVRKGEVASAVVTAGRAPAPVAAKLRDGKAVASTLPGDYHQELALMQERNVDVEIAAAPISLINAVPFLLLLAVWFVMMFLMRRGKLQRLPGSL